MVTGIEIMVKWPPDKWPQAIVVRAVLAENIEGWEAPKKRDHKLWESGWGVGYFPEKEIEERCLNLSLDITELNHLPLPLDTPPTRVPTKGQTAWGQGQPVCSYLWEAGEGRHKTVRLGP